MSDRDAIHELTGDTASQTIGSEATVSVPPFPQHGTPSEIPPGSERNISVSPIGESKPILAAVDVSQLQIKERDDNDEVITFSQDATKMAPPWMVSMILHMAGMIFLAVLFLPNVARTTIDMTANFSEQLGEQLEHDFNLSVTDDELPQEPLITPDTLPPVEQPLLAPADLDLQSKGVTPNAPFRTPNIGIALNGREPGMKKVLLLAYGGDATTEAAVRRGLEWLKRNQRSKGNWSLRGPYSNGAHDEDQTAATAMALLAFQGAGNTHRRGDFKDQVAKGWRSLVRMQKPNGDFWHGSMRHHRLYAQAQATIAACELYGMTKDSALRLPAQRAIDYAVEIQDDLGGWRYRPGSESDTSVTGWFVMALQSAQMAGLNVPTTTLERVSAFLDSVSHAGGSTYSYLPNQDPTYSMTAEGLLCRQYLGWGQFDERMVRGIRHLTALPPDWSDRDVYYWYYATQTLHHVGG